MLKPEWKDELVRIAQEDLSINTWQSHIKNDTIRTQTVWKIQKALETAFKAGFEAGVMSFEIIPDEASTLPELVAGEAVRLQEVASDYYRQMQKAAQEASQQALNDYDCMMPGAGCAHAALKIAKLRVHFDEAREQAQLLEHLLYKATCCEIEKEDE